jgi:hypothetical protein
MRTASAARQLVPRVALAALLVVIRPALAAAQTLVSSFDQIGTRIRVGDEIRVTDGQGQDVRGLFVSVASTSLILDTHGARLRLRTDDISQVKLYYKDPGWDGALYGAVTGAAGLLALAYAGDPEMATDPEALPRLVALGAGGGALVGFIIDTLHRGQRTVFVRPPAAKAGSVLSVVPVIASGTKAVALVLSF